jgi:RimJ/RimL family protein N-acetyltransferase
MHPGIGDIILEGARVRLEPAGPEHRDGLLNASCRDEIWTYSPSCIRTIADMENAMNNWKRKKELGTRHPFVIIEKETGKIAGSTSCMEIELRHRKFEIGGTWLHPKAWRTRVNTECTYLLLRHAFEELKVMRTHFRTDARNERSNRALLRIGATFEGTLRKDMILHDGRLRDTNVYSILDDEWPEVRAKLLGYLAEQGQERSP